LFNFAAVQGFSFVLAAGLAVLGSLLSLGMPRALVSLNASTRPELA